MLGITFSQVDKDSFLGLEREDILLPVAADADYFSSATDGGAQAAVSITSAVAGTAINRSATGKRPLIYGRRPSITSVDNSGTNLSVTVRIKGKRFGDEVVQDITATGAGGGETVLGTKVVDEVTSITVIAISNAAASDTLSVGFDGRFLGLAKPIRAYTDVRMVFKIANGTPDAAGPKYTADFTSSIVKVADSSIDVYTLYSNTSVAVTDRYVVEYLAGAASKGFFRRSGLRFS